MPNKFVFFISTGRCGTGLFSKILNIKKEITSFHEDNPVCNGTEMIEFLKGDPTNLKSKMFLKKNKIKNCDTTYYADTSHVFIKSWGWLLNDIIPDDSEVFIIILKRKKESVINSFSKIHQSGLSESGKKWLFTVSKGSIKSDFKMKKNKILKIKLATLYLKFKNFLYRNKFIKNIVFNKFLKSAHLSSLDFHYEETYAMAKEYKLQNPNFKYLDFDFDTMLNIEGFIQLFYFLNTPLNAREIDLVKQSLNQKINDKSFIKKESHKYLF